MKKIIAALLTGLMALSLAACGSSGSSAAEASTSTEESTTPAVTGQAYDVGQFTVSVPEGWLVYPQADYFEEADADGNYPNKTDAIGMIKGGTSEMDTLSMPTVYVYYYAGSKAEDKVESDSYWYDETSPITATIKDQEITTAIEAKSSSVLDDGQSYVYDIVYYQINDNDVIQFTIPVDMIDFEGVSLTDADVQYILDNVTVNEG